LPRLSIIFFQENYSKFPHKTKSTNQMQSQFVEKLKVPVAIASTSQVPQRATLTSTLRTHNKLASFSEGVPEFDP